MGFLFDFTAGGAGELSGAHEGGFLSVSRGGSVLVHPADVRRVEPLLRIPGGRRLQGPVLQLVRGQQLQGVSGSQRHQEPQLCL